MQTPLSLGVLYLLWGILAASIIAADDPTTKAPSKNKARVTVIQTRSGTDCEKSPKSPATINCYTCGKDIQPNQPYSAEECLKSMSVSECEAVAGDDPEVKPKAVCKIIKRGSETYIRNCDIVVVEGNNDTTKYNEWTSNGDVDEFICKDDCCSKPEAPPAAAGAGLTSAPIEDLIVTTQLVTATVATLLLFVITK